MIKFLLNIKLVKIGGTDFYAVRKGWFLYRYADLYHAHLWWSKRSAWYKDCITKNLSSVERLYDQVITDDEVIK